MPISDQDRIADVEAAMKLANAASESTDLACRVGAVAIYAGLADFMVINKARAMDCLDRMSSGYVSPHHLPKTEEQVFDSKTSTKELLKRIRSSALSLSQKKPTP